MEASGPASAGEAAPDRLGEGVLLAGGVAEGPATSRTAERRR